MLPICLTEEQVEELFRQTRKTPGYQLSINLEQKTITSADGIDWSFDVDDFRRHCLLNGLDDIGLTLEHEKAIDAYEAAHTEYVIA